MAKFFCSSVSSSTLIMVRFASCEGSTWFFMAFGFGMVGGFGPDRQTLEWITGRRFHINQELKKLNRDSIVLPGPGIDNEEMHTLEQVAAEPEQKLVPLHLDHGPAKRLG